MEITSIVKQKGKKNNFHIYIDNKYAFTITESDLVELDLQERKVIDDKQYKYYVNYISEKNAYKISIRYLTSSMKTEHEMREKLKSKNISDYIIGKVINTLKEQKYINDKYYTELYIEEKKERLYSKYRIYNELTKKGIDRDLIKKKLNNLYKDEIDTIKKIIDKKFRYKKDIMKIKSYLFRNGFKMEYINNVFKNEEI